MRNRILQITRTMIPYVKELNGITGNILSSILMQQLDFWFERYPNGFWKFMEASVDHPHYKPGQSWVEETGMSIHEFRSAFDKIGFRHKSKSEYDRAEDKFHGRMYASYVDRRANLTYYVRNHALVDQKLDELVVRHTVNGEESGSGPAMQVPVLKADVVSTSPVNRQYQFPVNGVSQSTGNGQSQATANAIHGHPGNAVSQGAEVDNSASQGIEFPKVPTTETTKENTKQQLHTPERAADGISNVGSGSSFFEDLFYPNGLLQEERTALVSLMVSCPRDQAQDVLDELEGIRASNGIKRGMIPLALTLVSKAANSEFKRSAGISVAAQRERRLQNQEATQRQLVDSAPAASSNQGGGYEAFAQTLKAPGSRIKPSARRRI